MILLLLPGTVSAIKVQCVYFLIKLPEIKYTPHNLQFLIFSVDTNSYTLGVLQKSACCSTEYNNVMFLTQQPKQMPEFLRASPGSAPNWGAQCFSEMTCWANWRWGFWYIKHNILKREWQMWVLGWWDVTHKVNPQVPGEDKPCRRGKTFIWKQERGGKRDYST